MDDAGLASGIVIGAVSAVVMVAIFAITNVGPPRAVAVEEAMARGAVIVDVRTPGEFAAGHVRGAVNVPLDALPGTLDRARPVILYCASGARSAKAAKRLRAAAYTVVDAGTFQAFPEACWPDGAQDGAARGG